MSKDLESFLAEFPDDATCWSKATDELPTMYQHLAKATGLPPVGRENCQTPSEWNTKYKAAIRRAFEKLSPQQIEDFKKSFDEWIE
jgi:hypothetical protein